jgi:hypothetical protein
MQEKQQMHTMNAIGIGIVMLLIAGLSLSLVNISQQQRMYAIATFEECKDAGYPIMESFPEQCTTSDGRSFTNDAATLPDPIQPNSSNQKNGCVIAGCSSQLCMSAEESENSGITTCEFRAEYACYKSAVCEPQANGSCGWTPSDSLQQCLANPPQLDMTPQAI